MLKIVSDWKCAFKKSLIANHLNGRSLDLQLGQYKSFFLISDFSVVANDVTMKNFCQICSCNNIVKDKTSFKNPENPLWVDLIIANRLKSFQWSTLIETGLSDFHETSLTIMKVFYSKENAKVIQYRKYKNFSNEIFMYELESTLSRFSQISFGTLKTTVDSIL